MSFPRSFICLSSPVIQVLSEHLPWVCNPPDNELLDVNTSQLQKTQSNKDLCLLHPPPSRLFLPKIITSLNPSSCCTEALIFKPISRLSTDKEEDTSSDKLHKDWLNCIYMGAHASQVKHVRAIKEIRQTEHNFPMMHFSLQLFTQWRKGKGIISLNTSHTLYQQS